MPFKQLAQILVGSFLFCLTSLAVSAEDNALEGIKCPISGKPVKAEASADFKDGKVYFCCDHCVSSFAEKEKKYTIKANRQLVETGQYEQVACPISGGELDESESVKLGKKITVTFCCGKCKAKVEEAKEAKKGAMKLIFAAKPFEKAFAKAEEKEEKSKN